HTVLIIEVNGLNVQAPQAGFTGPAHVLGPAVDSQEATLWPPHVAELGGENNIIPPTLDSLPDQFLVVTRAVHVGGIQEIHTQVNREMNGGNRLLFVS